MSVITDLADYRRQRDQDDQPQEWWHRTIRITDFCTMHEVTHERRSVVQAGIDFLVADVETFGAGGWGAFNIPRRIGSIYLATGITVRHSDNEVTP